MQRGFMQRVCRRRGPDVWQFRWSETGPDGKRAHHKKVIGTVEQYADEHSARRAVVGLIAEINTDFRLPNSRTITIAELCDHFEQRELADQNNWRSHATKKIYKAYLNRWVRPHWQKYQLPEVRTIQVESCRWRKAVAPKSAI
jgi:integrase